MRGVGCRWGGRAPAAAGRGATHRLYAGHRHQAGGSQCQHGLDELGAGQFGLLGGLPRTAGHRSDGQGPRSAPSACSPPPSGLESRCDAAGALQQRRHGANRLGTQLSGLLQEAPGCEIRGRSPQTRPRGARSPW